MQTTSHAWLDKLTKPARILLVEDNHDDIQLFTMATRGWNVDLHIAPTGEEAMANFAPDKWKAVFIDLKLPGISGQEVFKRMRALDRDVPLYILSGYIDDTIQQDLPTYGRVNLMDKKDVDLSGALKSLGVTRLGDFPAP